MHGVLWYGSQPHQGQPGAAVCQQSRECSHGHLCAGHRNTYTGCMLPSRFNRTCAAAHWREHTPSMPRCRIVHFWPSRRRAAARAQGIHRSNARRPPSAGTLQGGARLLNAAQVAQYRDQRAAGLVWAQACPGLEVGLGEPVAPLDALLALRAGGPPWGSAGQAAAATRGQGALLRRRGTCGRRLPAAAAAHEQAERLCSS